MVLADEPAEALDTKNAILGWLARQGRSVIAATTDEHLAAAAHQRVHLVDGRVVRDGVQA